MKIFLSPQVSDEKISYDFDGEIITATYKDVSDTFDFTDLPDGRLELYDDEGNSLVKTKLEINPIVSAKKENGLLYVELLNFIGMDATEAERFPDWIDHTEYSPPKASDENG
ncbi:hypothetical protein CHCC20442_4302 [Bacillus licheniformis]|uniref:hypothetical protein n=1 Tax=Bacillus licheniformis TaxID=1402 RepID=UPI00119FEE6C|nr:hypothetical protein [Bacillus licheniformis]TWK08589.1 hypothetical protein CHCC20442_4302 [Bacillus licheniformis]